MIFRLKFLVLHSITALAVSAEPILTSWHTEHSARYARIFETLEDEAGANAVTTWSRGRGTQMLPTYSGVHQISHSADSIYLRTTGLGSHIMGPWYLNAEKTNLFPNYPANQAVIYRLPRTPGLTPTNKTLTGLGRIGLFVDGVAMFDSRDAFSYDSSAGVDDSPNAAAGVNGDGVWNRDAFVNESVTFDAANAHQAGSSYHYHANPPALRHQLGDSVDYDRSSNRYTENFNGNHSPILAWVSDGYPLYGPYGYSVSTDPTSAITRMRSGFRKRTITTRESLPPNAARDQGRSETLPINQQGPDVSAQFPIGHYLEDYEYLGDFGQTLGVNFDLDEHNGRFCVTPDFPEGTYAYFVSIEADGTPSFPYNIGRSYYGNPVGGVSPTIPVEAVTVFEGGPEKALTHEEINFSDNEVTVKWSAIEGGRYLTEASDDLSRWDPISFTQMANEFEVVEADNYSRRFYRASTLDVATFDDVGFDYEALIRPKNNILLIIVDDWGFDSSPLDNPNAVSHASMPNYASLADQGVRFTNAYAQPTCSPTRAGILTGRYSFRHGVGSPGGINFPVAEVTMPDAFAAANSPYVIGSVGKWHLGGGDDGPQTLGGWSEFRGTLNSGVESYFDWSKTINGVTTANNMAYTTSDQVNDALSLISDAGTQPWMCWLALNAPHGPFEEPPAALISSGSTGGGQRGIYERMLEAMDTELGRLLTGVDLTKTNVIILGDNGTPGNVAQSPVIRERAKASLYEGGIKVPMIALGPDVRARGTSDVLVQCTDIYATVLDLAGVPVNPEVTLDSRSLLGVFNGNTNFEGGVVLEDFGNVTDAGRAIRIGDYKLILYEDGREEFYQVATDIAEIENLLLRELTAVEQSAYDALIARNDALGSDDGSGGTDATGIVSLSPATGVSGQTVTVTFNLDPAAMNPAVPGTNLPALRATIGGVEGTSISRPSRYVLMAEFVLPASGVYDAEIVFTGPQMRTFGLQDAFEVN